MDNLTIKDDRLKPCPRCSGRPVVHQQWLSGHPGRRHFKAVCSECGFNYGKMYRKISKAVYRWNVSGIEDGNIQEYMQMSKENLVQLILDGELIPFDEIKYTNKIVLDKLQKDGYTIVSMDYLERCKNESLELAKIKINKEGERGKALWEDDV